MPSMETEFSMPTEGRTNR